MTLVHRLPDPQGSKGNKMRIRCVEERRAVDGWLNPSLAKLDLTNHSGERVQGNTFLLLYFLSFNPLSHAWGPHVRTSGVKSRGRNDAASLLHRVICTQDQE